MFSHVVVISWHGLESRTMSMKRPQKKRHPPEKFISGLIHLYLLYFTYIGRGPFWVVFGGFSRVLWLFARSLAWGEEAGRS
jgi:hypothetical protein